jgi:hypothetical protein
MERAGGDETPIEVTNYSRRWWILAVLGVAQLMVILDGTIVTGRTTPTRDLPRTDSVPVAMEPEPEARYHMAGSHKPDVMKGGRTRCR